MLRRPRAGLPAVFPAAALLVAGCSSGDSPTAATTPAGTPAPARTAAGSTSYPLAVDNCGQKITFSRAPQRVLILNGDSVGEIESFIALGLADRVMANAQSYGISDDPQMVDRIKAVPTGGLTLNENSDVPAEQVLALRPDLVVSTWSGGFDGSKGFATRGQLAEAGINTLVNPVNCAYGATEPSPADRATHDAMSLTSSTDFIRVLGQVFDMQAKASQVNDEIGARIASVRERVNGTPEKRILIVTPGAAPPRGTGVPVVMSGGIYDDIATSAGGRNAVESRGPGPAPAITSARLAAVPVDLLVVCEHTPDGKPAEEAAALFARYPQWHASTTTSYVAVSDSIRLGPLNALAVEKIAYALHRDAF